MTLNPSIRLALLLLNDSHGRTVEVLPTRPVTIGTNDEYDIVARGAQPSRKTPAATVSWAQSSPPSLALRLAPAAQVCVNNIRVVGSEATYIRPGDSLTFGALGRDAVECCVVLLGSTSAHSITPPKAVAQRKSPLRRDVPAATRPLADPDLRIIRRSPLRVPHPRRFVDPCVGTADSPPPLRLPPTLWSALSNTVEVPPAPHTSLRDAAPDAVKRGRCAAQYRVAPTFLCCNPNGTREILPTAANQETNAARQLMTTRGLRAAPTNDNATAAPPHLVMAQGIVDKLISTYSKESGTFPSDAAHAAWVKDCGRSILCAVSDILRLEPVMVRVSSPCWCCGDLHGSFGDLLHILENAVPFGTIALQSCPFVFLGDYVDRGDHSVEVILLLMAWKVLHPNMVWLLRGNHEDREVNGDVTQYGDASFRQRCCDLLGEEGGVAFWEDANAVFTMLPVAAVVDESVLLCHGGVPHMSLVSQKLTGYPGRAGLGLEEMLAKLQSLCGGHEAGKSFATLMPLPHEEDTQAAFRQLLRELVWNDPSSAVVKGPTFDEHGFRCNVGRGDEEGVIHEFSVEAVESFLEDNGWSLMIRAHQHKHNGVEIGSHAKVLTLFSSCNYANENAAGACFLANQQAHLVSWRRAAMSPPRGLHTAAVPATVQDTVIPMPTWSCGLLPSSAHFSLHLKTAQAMGHSERRGPSLRLDLDTARRSPTPRCSPASDGTPRPAKTCG